MAPLTKAKKSADPHKKTATHKRASKKAGTKAPTANKKAKPRASSTGHKAVKSPHKRSLVPKKTSKKEPSVKKEVSYGMNEEQKIDLLHMIDLIVQNRKHKPDGLRSFYMIDRILDHYNQKYTHPETKFNAIVRYGAEKHDGINNEHIYVFSKGKEKDESELYHLLADINAEKVKFADIKKRLQQLIEENKT